MRRLDRPPIGDAARRLIAIRVDPDVVNRFREEATWRQVGYQTFINQVLAEYVQNTLHDGAAVVTVGSWHGTLAWHPG
jgi:uncharacterized protein (DUF4415 family)